MSVSPQQVRTASFTIAKKGYDTGEVDAHLRRAAEALEEANAKASAMEARARAAVAKLQEVQAEQTAPGTPDPETETISRTLLLAQRTADTTIADAERAADELRTTAANQADETVADARAEADRLVTEARTDARGAFDEERRLAESEVQALRARRDFLEGDVDHLERFLVDQRERIRDVASNLVELTERVPGGLGDVRRPLLSADPEQPVGDSTTEVPGAASDGDDETMALDAIGTDGADGGEEIGVDSEASEGDDAADVVIVTQDEVEGVQVPPGELGADVPTGELPLVTSDTTAAAESAAPASEAAPESPPSELTDPDATQALPATPDQPVLSLGSMPRPEREQIPDEVPSPTRPTRFSFRGGRRDETTRPRPDDGR